jgi:ParB family chromosome partitioning protein
MILEKKLSPGHARAILQVAEEDQETFAQNIVNNIFSVRKAEQEAKVIKEKDPTKKTKVEVEKIPELINYEKKLKQDFKTRVKISGKLTKGKITFYYSSKKDLERLITVLESNE